MRLYTIQPVEVYEVYKKNGMMTPDPLNAPLALRIPDEFILCYDFMAEEMRKRVPGYPGGYPLWFWTKRPDLRKSGHLPKCTIAVLLEVEVNEDMVLYSNFHQWNMVLNGIGTQFYTDPDYSDSKYSLEERMATWSYVFDNPTIKELLVNSGMASDDIDSDLELQATTGPLPIDVVVKETLFVAR